MGAIIAYELIKKLDKDNSSLAMPRLVLLSGCNAPQNKIYEKIYNLSEDEFKQKIISYGAISSKAIFENRELKRYFLPILRADFEALENYKYIENHKIPTNMLILSGTHDKNTSYQGLQGWKELILGDCTFIKIEGNHFFPFENLDAFTNAIKKHLELQE